MVLIALLSTFLGCSNGTDTSAEKICAPGQQLECACGGGAKGFQVCNTGGSGFDPCQCGGSEEEEDAYTAPSTLPEEVDTEEEEPCQSHAYTDCIGNNLHWFNSCLEQEELVAVCEPGQCKLNADSCCPGKVPQCYDNDIYWFDSCGVLGELKESCPSGTVCKTGASENAPPACAVEANCTPGTYEACHNPSEAPNATDALGNVFSFNSCDEPEGIVEVCACQEICNNNACVKTFWDGKWTVSLSGSCALGSAINYTNVTFDVNGEEMVVKANVGGKEVIYNGTMDCSKSFTVTGSLTSETLGITVTATESWNCQFDSLTHFTGQVLEESDFGTCLYDLEGFRN